jgi:hypothetical protein
MGTRSTRAGVRAAALASALLLAACGGDDSSSDSATTTASPGSASPSTAARDTATPPTTGGADTGAPATTIAPATKTVRFVVANTNIPVTFTAPADAVTTSDLVLSPTHWTVDEGWGAHKGLDIGMVGVQFAVISNIYADGCQHSPLAPPVGPTVDDLAEAWANLPQYSATAAVEVTIDGYAGKQVEFTVPEYNVGECGDADSPVFALWQVPSQARPGFVAAGPTMHIEQRILDVNGTRLVISAYYSPSSPPQDRAALDEVLASIQIG